MGERRKAKGDLTFEEKWGPKFPKLFKELGAKTEKLRLYIRKRRRRRTHPIVIEIDGEKKPKGKKRLAVANTYASMVRQKEDEKAEGED